MKTKILKVCVCFVMPLFIVGIIILQTVGADMWNSNKIETKPIDLLKSQEPYGPLRLVEPPEIGINKDITYYEDDKYCYSVQEDGKILSLIRHETTAASSKSLTREQAIAVAEKMIKNISPEFSSYSFDASAEQFDEQDTPWRVFHRLMDEQGIIYGEICTFIDRDGEVRMLSSDTAPEKMSDENLQKSLIDKERAIALAYQAVEIWAEQSGYVYDLEDKNSHTIMASQHYDSDQASICWIVWISNVKKTHLESVRHQSFLIIVDGQTSEVLDLFPSR